MRMRTLNRKKFLEHLSRVRKANPPYGRVYPSRRGCQYL
jgi:hypothetical protein